MKKLLIAMSLVLVLAAISIVGCASAPRQSSVPTSPTPDELQHSYGLSKSGAPVVVPAPAAPPPVINIPVPAPAPTPPPVVIQTPPKEAAAAYTNIDTAFPTDRMIVRTGNISLVVDDVPSAIKQITSLAQGMEGYVVSSNVWEEGVPSDVVVITPGAQGQTSAEQEWKRFAGAITIRVPSDQYEAAMSALRGMAVKVTSENSSSQDVTEEYVDLSAKLKNLEATEEQLLRLMEKAEKVEDILNIQRELSNVRGNIEQTKGRMQYLERTTSTSLINVQLQQAKLDISFTASKSRVKRGEAITFFPQIAGGISPYSYEWDFGDGRTSTDGNPTHTYNTPGDYTVTLKVTDDRGASATKTRADYIMVMPGWNAGNIASGAWNGLVTFAHVLANIIIWLGIFSPVWIIGGGIAYWIIRRQRARRK
jgi:hypothetical protein